MQVRGAVAAAILAAMTMAALEAAAVELRPAIGRPEILEVGDPILITRKMLAAEMRRNSDLRDWVNLYGAPEYAEVQEVEIVPPWAPYEVRLYYIRQNSYLAFGRVHVAPNVYDYGVRKYVGHIDPEVLDRLLTARPATAVAEEQGETTALQTVPPEAVIVETVPVTGVPVAN